LNSENHHAKGKLTRKDTKWSLGDTEEAIRKFKMADQDEEDDEEGENFFLFNLT